MPPSMASDIEIESPGWIEAQAEIVSGIIDARLRKRYAAPFESPYPHVIQSWVTRILTLRAFLRRGVDARDAQFQSILDDATRAEAEIKEAATAQDGLFELPLRQTLEGSTAVTRSGTRSYTEHSPYTWTTEQQDAVRTGGEW